MTTLSGAAAAARQAASGYALRALPHIERLTPLPGTSTGGIEFQSEKARHLEQMSAAGRHRANIWRKSGEGCA